MSQDDNSSISSHESSKSPDFTQKKKKKKIIPKTKNKIIINISDCQYSVVSKVSKDLNWKLQTASDVNDWDIMWTDNAVQPQVLLKMQQHQKINHFPGMFNLARKNMMGRHLMKMRKKFPNGYSFFPLTWMLPIEYHELRTYFENKPKGKARTFIVKPEALSQGKGIFLTRKIQEIDQTSHCVVQRYLHKPYLIDGLKFDLRIYVLVASVEPLRLYIFHEGLTRFATQKYEPPTKQNMEQVCMHLTNYAINKDNPKFVFNSSEKDMTKGHKRSLTWLFDYLQQTDPHSQNLKQKIQEMIVKTMISALPAISSQYRSCQPENYAGNMCFQLLGFDIILTQKCQPILLQINHTPSFSTDTPLDKHIKFNYIKDSLVLMNINQKTKCQTIKERRQACHQRVVTGKKIKYTFQEKEQFKAEAQAKRDKYENQHLGGFKKIFPVENEQKMKEYQEYMSFAHENFLISTGTKKHFHERKSQKCESAFGSCFAKKSKDPKNIHLSQRARDSIPDSSNLMKRKFQNKAVNEEKKDKKLARSQNLINQRTNSAISELEQLAKKMNEDQQMENSKEEEEEKIIEQNMKEYLNEDQMQKQMSAEQFHYEKYFKTVNTINPTRFDNRPKDRIKETKNLKNVEIMFQNGETEENRKNTLAYGYQFSKSKQVGEVYSGKYKLVKGENDKKKQKWESKFSYRNSCQKEKIPITLNTLLISGFDSSSNQSANNLKKILCNQFK